MLLNCDSAENTSPRVHNSADVMNPAKKKIYVRSMFHKFF